MEYGAGDALEIIADIGAVREKHGDNKKLKTKTIYDSMHHRTSSWYALSWMYCGCCEPTYLITDHVIKGFVWEGCYLVSDVMAWEQVTDISRHQTCCYACLSCCGCAKDMATITLTADDDSHPGGWQLVRIKNSLEVYKKMNRILTEHGKVKKKKAGGTKQGAKV